MLKTKEFDDVIRHIEGKAYNSAIILLRAMKYDAESAEVQQATNSVTVPLPPSYKVIERLVQGGMSKCAAVLADQWLRQRHQ